ncbi:PucR family transcriptional regulator ligand-binding domain-containing protein [Pseudomonas aeruginosa]|nr:PucR family transcriptional regulator ligand-binding domain-containing protein [Pseudomonas aeruginosa]MBN5495488.1 PucR family transcriptional regulator ligand-binding domain-containing protein [Pseudomonas aeruginosa]
MTLSIHDLVENASLRTRLLNGEPGLSRRVRWAHVCELADPTEWLGEGDLLMTTGIGIPSDPAAQRLYLERLAHAKVAGLMIGENMQAPADLSALGEAAEQQGFPLLMTHYSVPFSAVTRAILDAGRQQEFERRNAISHVYESARMGLRGIGVGALLERLQKDVKAHLYLFDAHSLEPWLQELEQLPDTWQQALLARRLEIRGTMPAVLRCTCTDVEDEALVMALPTQPSCEMLAVGGELLDYGLLHHVVAVLGIELERLQVEQERQLRLGSELLDDLLQQRLAERAARERLEQMHCPVEPAVVALARPSAELPDDWQRHLRRHGLEFLARSQGQELILLLADPDMASRMQTELGCALGVGNPLGHPARALEALREARLAFAHTSVQRPLVAYGSAQALQPWLPDSLDEADRIHRAVLGLLVDYDQQQGTQLHQTLRVFLEQNRSWQKAAQHLNVHKQTLVYRVHRIEEITGRSLDNTQDVAVLWIALRAGDIAGING